MGALEKLEDDPVAVSGPVNQPKEGDLEMKPIMSIATILCALLSGVSTVSAGLSDGGQGQQAQVESICGAAIYPDALFVEVVSTGCTQPADFVFVIERGGLLEMDVQMLRINADLCDSFSRTVTLRFGRDELGLDEIDTMNFLNSWRGDCPERW